MDEIVWLHWEDLTQEEKKQARESYITIRELEEEIYGKQTRERYCRQAISENAGRLYLRGCMSRATKRS